MLLSLTGYLKALRLRRLLPELVCCRHCHGAFFACPPGVVDFAALPQDESRDLCRVAERNERLATGEAGELALSETVALQELSRRSRLLRLRPMVRQDADHAL